MYLLSSLVLDFLICITTHNENVASPEVKPFRYLTTMHTSIGEDTGQRSNIYQGSMKGLLFVNALHVLQLIPVIIPVPQENAYFVVCAQAPESGTPVGPIARQHSHHRMQQDQS